MKKSMALLASTIAATAIAVPASAQSAPEGARAELQVGWDRVQTSDDITTLNSDGLSYGIAGGYDFKVAPTVSLGFDVEVADSTVEESETGTIDGVDYDVSAEFGRDLYAGARLSFGVGDNANVYLKGGVTNVEADFNIFLDDGVTIIDESFSDDDTGWRVGGGLQFGLGTNAYAGGEYRYSDYGDGLDRHQAVATVGVRF